MKKGTLLVITFMFVLLLSSLACNASQNLPWNAGSEDIGISAEDVSIAATRAAEAAATAVAGQAGQTVATAVAQESGAVDTPVAGDVVAAGGSLQQKLANIQPDANGNFTVAITEDDLNEFIAGEGGAIQSDTLSAQNIGIQITSEHLELTGDVKEPVALPLVVKLRPAVTGGKLGFELVSASAGIFPVPDSMLDLIEAGANSELGRALAGLPSGVALQDATLADGVLTIFGQQK